MINYVKKSSVLTPEEAFEERMDCSKRFAAYHGKEFYTSWLKRLDTALTQVSLPPTEDIYWSEAMKFAASCGKHHLDFPDEAVSAFGGSAEPSVLVVGQPEV